MISIQNHKTKVGEFVIGSFENQLCLIDYKYRKMHQAVKNRIQQGLNAEFIEQTSPIIEETKKQLQQYFDGNRKTFDLDLLLVGSDFQKQVWQGLLNINYGQTISYGQLATNIHNPKSVRAVGSANGANAISIIVPCHRVIASDGSLGGYGGGLAVKKRLLKLEDTINNGIF